MMKNTKKFFAILLVLSLVLSLCACGRAAASSAAESAPVESAVSEETAAAPAEETVEEPAEEPTSVEEPVEEEALPPMELPLTEELVTYTIMGASNPNMTGFGEPQEYAIWQNLQERPNIALEWTTLSMDTIAEQHSLLVAANDLPEVVNGNYYTSGVASAIDEEVYWDLAPYLEENAPHYLQLIQTDGIRQQVYSDDGYVMFFCEIAEKEFTPNNGMMLRKDLLDKVGMDVPVTYDEYTDVMAAFKSELGMEAPFFVTEMDYNVFSAGFGVSSADFCLDDDGNLVYSPITENFKSYLKQFSDWYKAGYIYKDFYCIPWGNAHTYRADYMNNADSAITFCYCEFADMFEFADADAQLVPGYIPRQTADQHVHLTDGVDAQVKTGFAVSTNCEEEKMELFCQFMNYLYTEEGSTLANWGIEGETFEIRPDGSKWYTDEILNNPDGLTQTQALIFNFMYQGPCYADYTKYNISTMTKWKDFADVWASADNANKLPTLSLTAEEMETYSAKSNDVSTYMDEVIIKLMIGDMDVEAEWDNYIASLESLGVNEMIEIYEAAYERYQNK